MQRTVLVVDDSAFARRMIRDILESDGSVVHEAVNGRDAVRRFAELRPDVTTMDISMPVTDGLTATREILLLDHAARVVVVTAQDEGPGEAEALAAGAVGYLAKPFQPVELLATLDGVVPSAPEDG